MPTPSKTVYPNLQHQAQLAEWKASGKYPAWVTSKILREMQTSAGIVRPVPSGRWRLAPSLRKVKRPQRLGFLCAQIRLNSHILISLSDLVKRRAAFDAIKEVNFPLWDCKGCYCCGQFSSVRHHVIPIQHGGSNLVSNLVPLCEPCHAKVHPHLSR